MKKDSIDSQEEIRARLKEKMDNKRRKQSNSSRKSKKITAPFYIITNY